ncbi:MAG: hypothetical protein Q9191_006483 [Dirinaria sp. TL-2023a]
MTTITQNRKSADPAGPTSLAYTRDGKRLITAGSNNVIRVYTTGSSGEPINIDECSDSNLAVAASNDFFIVGSEDGAVSQYSLQTYAFDRLLTRCTLPIRDLAISPDGRWAAVASDELEVKLVDTEDMTNTMTLSEQRKSPKHLSFHPSGSHIAVSCTDGTIYIYSLSTETPQLIKKVDGLIRALEADVEICSSAVWHPDGRAFAAPTATRDIQVMSRNDWERQRSFSGGHMGDIIAMAWSPNGALLATAGADRKILLWETLTQKIIARYDYPGVSNIKWHPHENIVSFTSLDGELFIYTNFVTEVNASLLDKSLQPAPFIHDPLSETSGNARKPLANGVKDAAEVRARRRGTPDSLDDILGPDMDVDGDDFVDDDDGAGYFEGVNGNGKRTNDHLDLDDVDGFDVKRRTRHNTWQPKIHNPFQPSSTPWRGNRRYLCLNLIGFVWTVDQDAHHTVTVEFYDREYYRDFHFTDPYLYDKACLNENGTLFSCPLADENPAMIFYRPHETWTARSDWRTPLPAGEDITSISLSDSFVVATTSKNYVRIYTLYGTPFRVYRQKSSPTVTCTSWRDYVLTLGNGPVGGDGSTQLLYTIENIKRDEVCQSEDTVALTEGAEVKSLFFSDNGDPCIYDSTGVLLILQHWRSPGQARWVPLLDTRLLDRLAGGRKEESYWPVAVAQDKFHCIILKGGDRYPYFPRPLLTEFEFKVPCSTTGPEEEDGTAPNEVSRLEETFVRNSLLYSLLEDQVSATNATQAQRTDLKRREVEIDKSLLQLLNVECREGEDRGMKALEIVGLLQDRSGKMLEAAGKVASRYERTVLQEKIGELAEKRLMGLEDED